MKRIFAAVFAAVIMCVLGGCGSAEDALWYGMVMGTAGITEGSETAEIESGIENYAASMSRRTQNYQASEDSADGYKAAFKQAAGDGLEYAFAAGSDMEVPIYAAQNAHHGMRFVLFDGQPRASEGAKARIRGNTECVSINDEGYGFAAGYIAVKGGYRSLVFLSGANEGSEKDHFTGFVQGAKQAASELSLGDGAVSIQCEFAGSDELTPLRVTDALSLYNNGADMIVTDSENISRAVESAASGTDKVCADLGFDRTGSSAYVLFSVLPDYANATQELLKKFEEKDGFDGGNAVELGISEKAYRISMDWSRISGITEAEFDTMLDEAAAGSITCMTSEDAEKESNDASSGLNAATSGNGTVTVEMINPVTPNGNSGLSDDGASASSAASGTESSAVSDSSSAAESASAQAESVSSPESTASYTDQITPDSSDD